MSRAFDRQTFFHSASVSRRDYDRRLIASLLLYEVADLQEMVSGLEMLTAAYRSGVDKVPSAIEVALDRVRVALRTKLTQAKNVAV